jgi:hypothetical protein
MIMIMMMAMTMRLRVPIATTCRATVAAVKDRTGMWRIISTIQKMKLAQASENVVAVAVKSINIATTTTPTTTTTMMMPVSNRVKRKMLMLLIAAMMQAMSAMVTVTEENEEENEEEKEEDVKTEFGKYDTWRCDRVGRQQVPP